MNRWWDHLEKQWSSVLYLYYQGIVWYTELTAKYGATYRMLDGTYKYFPPR